MKSILAICAGFMTMIILEGFARIIIVFYHREDLVFSGLQSLPSITWIIVLLLVILLLGIFGTLLTTTLAGFDPLKHTVSLASLVLILRFIPALLRAEQNTYLLTLLPVTISLIGIFIGFVIKSRLINSNSEVKDIK